MGDTSREDEAWRAIVENYGDRPTLEDPEPGSQEPSPGPDEDEPRSHESLRALFADDRLLPSADAEEWESDLARSDEERFVPPPPPPVPRAPRDRTAAWLGVIAAPAVLLVLLVLPVRVPQILVLGLVAAFVGGFVYLVVQMPREPRDPGDDGARL